MILVTGCARSGGQYVAKVLGNLGLKVGFDETCDVVVSWYAAVDDIADPVERPGYAPLKPNRVVHLVRNPVNVISACAGLMVEEWSHIWRFCRQVPAGAPAINQAAFYWLGWNNVVEVQASYKPLRIESFTPRNEEIGRMFGVKVTPEAFEGVPKNLNTRPHEFLTWGEVRKAVGGSVMNEIESRAIRYGYHPHVLDAPALPGMEEATT